jgi:two-component system response regulator YesN
LKLVIVDDEMGIIEGLKTMVKRYLPECEVVGTAYHGIEGCRLVQELKPDIVITDIRMPQCDGLEMIHRLKLSGSKAKFIVLSGFSEFEYAKKGIELGVKFYLNKPVEEEELEACVKKVIAEINSENVQERQWNEWALRDILNAGYESDAHESLLMSTLPFPVTSLPFVCVLIEFNCEQGVIQEETTNLILGKLNDGLRHYSQVKAFRYEGCQYAVIIMNDKKFDEKLLIRSIQSVQKSIQKEWDIPMSAGVGLPYSGLNGISKSFDEAQQALRYKVIKGAHAVIPFRDIEQLSGSHTAVPEEDMAKLEACLEDMDFEGCAAVIQRIFLTIESESRLNLMELKLQCLHILLSSIRRIPLIQLQLNENLGKNILSLEAISRFKTLEELKAWLIQVIHSIIELKSTRHISKKKDVISEIKEYVADHYDTNITLADLSARFFINPYYLSQLFKEKTGDTYLSYVTGIRMNQARELLQDTDLKVYEVCQKVGYSDTNHFSKLFEKLNGCTPSEFRKKSK